MQLNKLVRLVRIFKLLRVLKAVRILKAFEDYAQAFNPALMRLAKLTVMLLVVWHYMACTQVVCPNPCSSRARMRS